MEEAVFSSIHATQRLIKTAVLSFELQILHILTLTKTPILIIRQLHFSVECLVGIRERSNKQLVVRRRLVLQTGYLVDDVLNVDRELLEHLLVLLELEAVLFERLHDGLDVRFEPSLHDLTISLYLTDLLEDLFEDVQVADLVHLVVDDLVKLV